MKGKDRSEEEAVTSGSEKKRKGKEGRKEEGHSLLTSFSPSLSLHPHSKNTTQRQDCKSPDVKLTNDAEGKHGHLVFRGKGEGADPEAHEYGLDLDLFAAIDVEGSKVATSDRGVVLVVAKADKDAEEHWPRLLKAAGKSPANIVS